MFYWHAELCRTVRPVPIVSRQHYVNLARSAAEKFGQVELVGPHQIPHHSTYEKPLDDVIVTTKAQMSDTLHNGQQTKWDSLESAPRGFFADQFEVCFPARGPCIFIKSRQNLANFEAHLEGTGPEIWRQTSGFIDAFVAGAGKCLVLPYFISRNLLVRHRRNISGRGHVLEIITARNKNNIIRSARLWPVSQSRPFQLQTDPQVSLKP